MIGVFEVVVGLPFGAAQKRIVYPVDPTDPTVFGSRLRVSELVGSVSGASGPVKVTLAMVGCEPEVVRLLS